MSTRTMRRSKRWVAAAAAVAIGVSTIAISSPASASTTDPTDERFSGADRYATAANLALAGWSSPVDDIIIASGEDFPDGLAASGLAGVVNSPILLTAKDSLPTSTAFALSSLAPSATSTVHIIGGEAAISASVRAQIASAGYDINEIAGADRYATAIEIASTMSDLGVNPSTVLLATGQDYPDALAAGGLAAEAQYPLLLNPSNTLRADVRAAIVSLDVSRVVILGGTAALSAQVATEVASLGVDVERVSGANRYATAAEFGEFYLDDLGYGAFGIMLVSGENFPDALAAGPATGCNTGVNIGNCGMPTMLVRQNSIDAPVAEFHVANSEDTEGIYAVGGTAVISDAVIAGAVAASTDMPPTALGAALLPDYDEAAVAAVLDIAGAPGTLRLTGTEVGAAANAYTVELDHDATATGVTIATVGTTITVTADLDTATSTTLRNAWNANAAARAIFTASNPITGVLGAAAAGSFDVIDFTTPGSIAYAVGVLFDENITIDDPALFGVHTSSSVFEPSLAIAAVVIAPDSDDEAVLIVSGPLTDPDTAAAWASITEVRIQADAVLDDAGQGNAAVVVAVP